MHEQICEPQTCWLIEAVHSGSPFVRVQICCESHVPVLKFNGNIISHLQEPLLSIHLPMSENKNKYF